MIMKNHFVYTVKDFSCIQSCAYTKVVKISRGTKLDLGESSFLGADKNGSRVLKIRNRLSAGLKPQMNAKFLGPLHPERAANNVTCLDQLTC